MELVQDLQPGFCFYRGGDPDYGLIVHQSSTRLSGGSTIGANDEEDLILILNEACSAMSKGKFYIFAPRDEASISEAIRETGARGSRELPDLLYLPHTWTEQDRDQWYACQPKEKLRRSIAFYDWLVEGVGQLFYRHPSTEMARFKLANLEGVIGRDVRLFWETQCGSVKLYGNVKLEYVHDNAEDKNKDMAEDGGFVAENDKDDEDDKYVILSEGDWTV